MNVKKFVFFILIISLGFFAGAKQKKLHTTSSSHSSNFIFHESKKDVELILSKFGEDEAMKLNAILRVDGDTYQVQTVISNNHCNAHRLRVNRKTKTASFLKGHFDCIKFEENL